MEIKNFITRWWLTIVLVVVVAWASGYWYRASISAFISDQYMRFVIGEYERVVRGAPNFAVHQTEFENTIRLTMTNPENAQAWLMLGNLQSTMDDYEGAEKSYLQAQKLSPQSDTVLWSLVQLYERTHQYQAAERWGKYALNDDPGSYAALGYLILADLYENYWPGKSDLAGGMYEQGWAQTHDPTLLQRLALYYQSRDAAKAVPYYKMLIASLPEGTMKTNLALQLAVLETQMGKK